MFACTAPAPILVPIRSHVGGCSAGSPGSVPRVRPLRRDLRAGCREIPVHSRSLSVQASASEARTHAERQASFFSSRVQDLRDGITPEIDARLHTIAGSVPGLGPASRVLDAGCGTGALIPHLQALGIQDILAVDTCPAMLAQVEARFGQGDSLGNVPCVRTWPGDVAELPLYQGPFSAVFFNAVFGNLYDQHAALLRATQLIQPGGYISISHPLGRAWLQEFRQREPEVVPHELPDEVALQRLIHTLPLACREYVDQPDMYRALLQVPLRYAFPGGPLRMSGPVISGFGRGSRQLGVPTANVPPEGFPDSLPKGVYFGWAQVDAVPDAPDTDRAVHKMVLNVGERPTFGDADPEVSVEAHIMHGFSEDFYGRSTKLVILGFMRPEISFGGLPELLSQIRRDIGIARVQLDDPELQAFSRDKLFTP
ncbi:RFK2 [Auxenochlorella protothecoides x Auxenochlorella symbiontica]